ncbi:Aste57867_19730 [Aphanomyces stellatus]|uniref:Aste57867_19730 protein n=1 Tax=Aphanomyces stellatus TaxID=120398 RepID=A0A485LEF7_9STRA|nr:hypothetical protein As57867_019665 [Aphanomyces stellatus]VFT96428.1 Aste57867_19730 [Aphanomyces stellatus]
MGESMAKRHRKWVQLMEEAVQADGWGQVLEAVEAYEKAAGVILQDLVDMELSDEQQDIVEKIVVTMNLRTTCLSAIDGKSRPSKDDMVALVKVLENILRKTPRVFPLDLAEFETLNHDNENEPSPVKQRARPSDPAPTHLQSLDDNTTATTAGLEENDGDNPIYLTITIQKIGLKDVYRYSDPQIVVSVVDKDLVAVEEKQETPISTELDPPYVLFESEIALRTNLHAMRQNDSTIFFEFVHYKKDKRKKSVRCWTMLEMDEIKPKAGKTTTLALELYTKPCDMAKKNVHLFTVKPLYLHVTLHFESTQS